MHGVVAVLVFVAFIAVFNLALGFAVAVALAQRQREQWPIDHALAQLTDSRPIGSPASQPAATPLQGAETTASDLEGLVNEYTDRFTAIDDMLRTLAQGEDIPEAGEVASCLETLGQAASDYRQSQAGDLGIPEELSNALEAAFAEQSAQIEATTKAIDEFDHGGDLRAACEGMYGETTKLISANHNLRDTLVHAAAECQQSGEGQTVELVDPLTGLPNRAALDAEIARALGEPMKAGRSPAVVLLDVDAFGAINDTHGFRVSDRVLKGIAESLAELAPQPALAARYAGQRFAVLLRDTDLLAAASAAERIRQGVEKICFETDGRSIRLTLSAGAAVGRPGDDASTLLARASAAMAESKRSGRNRTYASESEQPIPIAPPSLTLDERTIKI